MEQDCTNESTIHHSLFTYSRFFALAVALLFVAHPIQTEAVTYVFQRSCVPCEHVLSAFAGAVHKRQAVQAEAKVRVETRLKLRLRSHASVSALTCIYLSFLSAVLAMKTKENAFTLPVIITLYEFLFFSGPLKSRVLRLAAVSSDHADHSDDDYGHQTALQGRS